MSPRHAPTKIEIVRFPPADGSSETPISVGDQSRSQSAGFFGKRFQAADLTTQLADVPPSSSKMRQSMLPEGVVKFDDWAAAGWMPAPTEAARAKRKLARAAATERAKCVRRVRRITEL